MTRRTYVRVRIFNFPAPMRGNSNPTLSASAVTFSPAHQLKPTAPREDATHLRATMVASKDDNVVFGHVWGGLHHVSNVVRNKISAEGGGSGAD